MTEVPRRRRPLKKGELLGRQTTYRDFSIVHVESTVSDKTNRQWKEEGRQTLFGEAMAKARKKEIDDQMAEQGTFITAAPNAGSMP
jgi:trimethylamine:corrinoid methyltransferase-like protein